MINVHYGDSYVVVEPYVPEELKKSLSYWHKQLVWDCSKNRRVSSGETRRLYELATTIHSETGSVVETLTTLPGFATRVKEKLEQLVENVNVIDERTPRPKYDMQAAMAGLRDYQMPAVYDAVFSGGGIIQCPTGWGKCLSPDTPIIYYDGSIRPIEEVQVGELLMGDDSTPRKVLDRIDGEGPMYRIKPTNGPSFDVADDHILCLVTTDTNKEVDIMLSDYLKQSKTFKHRHKLYRHSVDFDHQEVRVDPYFLGLWLGDGSWNNTTITTLDRETVDYLTKYASELGLRLSERRYPSRCPGYAIVGEKGIKDSNTLRTAMKSYGLLSSKDKTVPSEFMRNSKEVRLKLLAGLLDSDGSLNEGTDFDWVNTNPKLSKSIADLGRSLGLRVHESSRQCEGFGKITTGFRVRITGNTHTIPTRLVRKKAKPRRQKKNPLRAGFSVVRVEDGPYVGVKLDGNMKHLLGDCTVTHNTHLAAGVINAHPWQELCHRGTCTTILVNHTKDLAMKNYRKLQEILPDRRVGLVSSDLHDISDDVQVVTAKSLHHIPLEDVGLILYDEVHTLTPAIADVLMRAGKALRYGISATPTGRYDNADLLTFGIFGPIIYSCSYAEAIKDGAVVPITVYWLRCPPPATTWTPYRTHDANYRNGVWRNIPFHETVREVLAKVPQDMQVLGIVDKLEHMDRLAPFAPGVTMVHAETNQKSLAKRKLNNLTAIKSKERREIYKAVEAGKEKRVVSSGIYRVGVDFPKLAGLINLAGVGSEIIAGQLPGRASRNVAGKDSAFLIDFYHDWDIVTDDVGAQKNGSMLSDDTSREKVYRNMGFEQIWLDSVDNLTFEGGEE
jgi:superfamily II DNA or RNA helicase